MFYHATVDYGGYGFAMWDMSKKSLTDEVIKTYEYRDVFVIGGRTYRHHDLEVICIYRSKSERMADFEELESEVDEESEEEWDFYDYLREAAADDDDDLEDVTDEWIKVPAGSKKRTSSNVPVRAAHGSDIFIVHGHDNALKDQLEVFLSENKLKSIVLHRKPDQGQTIIEKFEKHSRNAGFAFILLTPDDIGYPNGDAKKPDDKRRKEARARQNVIFEFGFFVARLGRGRVCCLYNPSVELPTDVNGMLYKKISGTVDDIGYHLLKELKSAGFDV